MSTRSVPAARRADKSDVEKAIAQLRADGRVMFAEPAVASRGAEICGSSAPASGCSPGCAMSRSVPVEPLVDSDPARFVVVTLRNDAARNPRAQDRPCAATSAAALFARAGYARRCPSRRVDAWSARNRSVADRHSRHSCVVCKLPAGADTLHARTTAA